MENYYSVETQITQQEIKQLSLFDLKKRHTFDIFHLKLTLKYHRIFSYHFQTTTADTCT